MAMLAEPRRKQKWALNPRGKDWSDDSNKFGQKLLEKMGWSNGKGLGANLDGVTDHVKVSYKNDSLGMGFKDRGDQWTQHETQFNSLLKSLYVDDNSKDTELKEENVETDKNNCGFNGFKQSEEENSNKTYELSGVSLEEKSKKSKSRVHYHKFTRGKDISRYSKKDLANIFGKKFLSDASPEPVAVAPLNYGIVEPMDSKEKEIVEHTFGITTVQSSRSMADYFKSKMPKSYKKNKFTVGSDGVLISVKEEEEIEISSPIISDIEKMESNNVIDMQEQNVEIIEKRKKKNKKSKKTLDEDVNSVMEIRNNENTENELQSTEKLKKKLKKSKDGLKNNLQIVSEQCSLETSSMENMKDSLEQNNSEIREKRKKKKNKSKVFENDTSEESNSKSVLQNENGATSLSISTPEIDPASKYLKKIQNERKADKSDKDETNKIVDVAIVEESKKKKRNLENDIAELSVKKHKKSKKMVEIVVDQKNAAGSCDIKQKESAVKLVTDVNEQNVDVKMEIDSTSKSLKKIKNKSKVGRNDNDETIVEDVAVAEKSKKKKRKVESDIADLAVSNHKKSKKTAEMVIDQGNSGSGDIIQKELAVKVVANVNKQNVIVKKYPISNTTRPFVKNGRFPVIAKKKPNTKDVDTKILKAKLLKDKSKLLTYFIDDSFNGSNIAKLAGYADHATKKILK